MTASLSFQVYTGCTFKNHLLPHPPIDPGVRPLEKNGQLHRLAPRRASSLFTVAVVAGRAIR